MTRNSAFRPGADGVTRVSDRVAHTAYRSQLVYTGRVEWNTSNMLLFQLSPMFLYFGGGGPAGGRAAAGPAAEYRSESVLRALQARPAGVGSVLHARQE